MKFKIASAGNNSCFGNLFYTAPSEKANAIAEKEIIFLCKSKINELHLESTATSRFETEYEMLQKAKTAFQFLLLREIADLSHEQGYPIMLEGRASGSIISYLLGITSINPMQAQMNGFELAGELVWEGYENPKEPDFSFAIGAPIRELIHSRLDNKFSSAESDDSIYKHIGMPNSTLCEKIGKLSKLTTKTPTIEIYQNDIYLCVIKDLADGLMSGDDALDILVFSEQLKKIDSCDFSLLTKIYGYCQGSFSEKKTLANLYNNKFYTLLDELYAALVECSIPGVTAFNIAKSGVWSSGSKREQYNLLLEEYDVPHFIRKYFGEVSNLWPASACISRLQLLCTLAWFQMNYPEEFAEA